MNGLLQISGISKQGFHKQRRTQQARLIQDQLIIEQAHAIRKDHPKMGCRKMYKLMSDSHLGKNRLEKLLLDSGFRVRRPKNYRRTTYSIKTNYYPNLIKGLKVDGINQLWQTDITYLFLTSRFYYLVFILDVYSRRIIGFSASDHMYAEANIDALKRALRIRKGDSLQDMIHHSDRGSQYIDKEYNKILKARGINPSMCQYAWENAYAERINGIMKNEYLIPKAISGLADLKRQLVNNVRLYNNGRPHNELPDQMSPVQFENWAKQQKKLPEMVIDET